MTGPWGGIQSELPLSLIEKYGVADAQNVLFQRGVAKARPAYIPGPAFPAIPNEFVTGFADFYNALGARLQVIFTNTRVIQWNPVSRTYTVITGPALSAGSPSFTSWTVLNQKLCFTQNAFPQIQGPPFNVGGGQVMQYDGISGVYTLTSASSPSAVGLAEIALHLVAVNTLEGGVQFPQRYRWSGVGDPTDWTSFSAGLNDILVDLGPVLGVNKLGQYGFGYHVKGIMQVLPTGIGTNPFAFIPITTVSNGIQFPYSLDKFDYQGVDCAAFVGATNVFLFNQTSVLPIGDAPIDGNKRVGARKRIMADVNLVNTSLTSFPGVFGCVTQSLAGNPFFGYLIPIIPKKGIWAYNFDEGNWSFWNLDPIAPGVIGKFITNLGSGYSPPSNDAVAIGNSGNLGSNGSYGVLDGTAFSENGIGLKSGKLIFDDRRHDHAAKKIRVVIQDIGPCTYSMSLTNERGQSGVQQFTAGTGSGDDLTVVLSFSVPGLRLQWTLNANAGQPFSVIEVAPIFSVGGEQRGGVAL